MARSSAAALRDPRPLVPAARRRRAKARYRRRRQAPARPRRAVERLGPLRADRADRLRRRLAEPRGSAAVRDHGDDRRDPQGHHPQQLARHRLRPLDQSLSRLRARLRLLLRAADPRLSRPVARARFRDRSCSPSRTRRSCWSASCRRRATSPRTIAIGTNTDPYQPIERRYEVMRAHPRGAGARRPSGRHRHQIGAGAARPRHPVAHGAGATWSRWRSR